MPVAVDRSQLTMLPEWAPQSATWLTWPSNTDTWSQNLEQAQDEFTGLVHAIATHQCAYVMCGGSNNGNSAQQQIIDQHRDRLTRQQIQNIRLIDIPTNDAWARDYGPTFVKSGDQLHSIEWNYNAWGGKYPPFDLDQQVATRIAQELQIKNHKAGICLEGGALEINSKGVLLVTRSSIFDVNRNPITRQTEIETVFKRYLGAKQIVWLPGDTTDSTNSPPVIGDDTDGHIDQLARFTDDQTIVYAWSEDTLDPQRPALEENLEELKRQMSAIDCDCRFVPLALPPAIEYCGLRIPASYCNFVITNDAVLVPQFSAPSSDHTAAERLTKLFPNRRIILLPSKNLTVGLGSFHCLTQQQPQ